MYSMVTVMREKKSLKSLDKLVSSLEFLNFEQGKKRCMNDEEFYLELVRVCRGKQAENLAGELSTAGLASI